MNSCKLCQGESSVWRRSLSWSTMYVHAYVRLCMHTHTHMFSLTSKPSSDLLSKTGKESEKNKNKSMWRNGWPTVRCIPSTAYHALSEDSSDDLAANLTDKWHACMSVHDLSITEYVSLPWKCPAAWKPLPSFLWTSECRSTRGLEKHV